MAKFIVKYFETKKAASLPLYCGPSWARTKDPLIMSQLL